MDGLALSMWPPTAWHWLAIGLILLTIEMGTGTFDLLWVAIAAGVTSLFAAFAPDTLAGWEGQLVVFAITSIVMVIIGRTVFRSMRDGGPEHPTLNKRMATTIGERATVTETFQAGSGRVKLGDTEWSAQSLDGANLVEGMTVIVDGTDGNQLKVRPV
ncbi:MAG: NfeD family protein [Henriciella sp.]